MALMATRLVPKDPEEQPTIFDLVQRKGWIYLKRVKPDPEKFIPGESIFKPKDADVTVHYVDDFIAQVVYILLKAEDLDELTDVADEIAEELPTYSSDEILQLYPAAKDEAERSKAIRLTGIAAPGRYDERYFAIFRAALAASETPVRLAAVQMTAYLGWRELGALLEPLRDSDADEGVRTSAGNIVSAMKAAQRP